MSAYPRTFLTSDEFCGESARDIAHGDGGALPTADHRGHDHAGCEGRHSEPEGEPAPQPLVAHLRLDVGQGKSINEAMPSRNALTRRLERDVAERRLDAAFGGGPEALAAVGVPRRR